MNHFSFNRYCRTLLYAILMICCTGCITEEVPNTSRHGVFHALWSTFDTRYCFFEHKAQAFGLNWQELYNEYVQRIDERMTEEQLFEVLSELCCELRDGHVNLVSTYGTARYGAWFDRFPANFSDTLERKYLGFTEDYRTTGTLKYRILQDNIAYVRCASFESKWGNGALHEMMRYLALCDGLILDLRHNGGGMLTAAEQLASLFINQKTHVGYMSHKTAAAHDAFSNPDPLYVEPFEGLRWQKPLVLLTNRRTYSAANSMVMFLKGLPNVTVMGDQTGGGSGMPFVSELPNGWMVRFSACPMFNREGEHTEHGIAPDIKVDITTEDFARSIDTIIEAARKHLKNAKP